MSLPPIVCKKAHVVFTFFVFVYVQWCPTRIVVSNTYYVVFVYVQWCPTCIVVSNTYCVVFVYVQWCPTHIVLCLSYVPCFANFSGLQQSQPLYKSVGIILNKSNRDIKHRIVGYIQIFPHLHKYDVRLVFISSVCRSEFTSGLMVGPCCSSFQFFVLSIQCLYVLSSVL